MQFLVEMLESQRDSAVAQAAANFRMAQELQAKVNELEVQANKGLDDQSDNEKIGGTD